MLWFLQSYGRGYREREDVVAEITVNFLTTLKKLEDPVVLLKLLTFDYNKLLDEEWIRGVMTEVSVTYLCIQVLS